MSIQNLIFWRFTSITFLRISIRIAIGACHNPFNFNKHNRDKTNFIAPKNEETDKDKKKHSEGGSPQQQKIVKMLISLNSSSIAS